ncbi:leucine-rich repeat-containing protein 15-like [Lytechinus variegatus]|uniref:leucine-rich repeat-containing protein 15-like n=1 Tax=Lytechinus variegatus TaxID=7654 RepID=UPI001BB21107|nr:leucine-rich repeat-containing protein 15-like [Lytechinus variegatus]
MVELVYIGLDMNRIEAVSKRSCKILAQSHVRFLNLSNNRIRSIAQNSLSQLKHLQILEIHHNDLFKVGPHIFHHISNLIHLDLNTNKLSVVLPRTFTDLPNLLTLRLHSQKAGFDLTSISYSAFHNAGQKMRTLFLSDNGLRAVPHGIFNYDNFENLETLFLEWNEITNASEISRNDFPGQSDALYDTLVKNYKPFYGLGNLETLSLANNLIDGISNDTFCEAPNLVHIDLVYNDLDDELIDIDAFRCLFSATNVILGYNNIKLVPQAFLAGHLQSLESVQLIGNKLVYLKSGAFTSLDTVKEFHLSENDIITIENNVFPPSTETIYLNDNRFEFTHEGAFQNLSSLGAIYLKYMRMKHIPGSAFFGDFNLQSIQLFGNDIEYLPKDIFRDTILSYTDMGYNDLTYIEPGTFSKHYYWTIYVYNNRLIELPFPDLQQTKMDYGLFKGSRIGIIRSWTFLNSAGKSFGLSGNRISRIEKNAFHGANFRYIDLKNNPIVQIDSFAFTSITAHTLDFENVQGTHISSKAFNNINAMIRWSWVNGRIELLEDQAFHDISFQSQLPNADMDFINCKIVEVEGRIISGNSKFIKL